MFATINIVNLAVVWACCNYSLKQKQAWPRFNKVNYVLSSNRCLPWTDIHEPFLRHFCDLTRANRRWKHTRLIYDDLSLKTCFIYKLNLLRVRSHFYSPTLLMGSRMFTQNFSNGKGFLVLTGWYVQISIKEP